MCQLTKWHKRALGSPPVPLYQTSQPHTHQTKQMTEQSYSFRGIFTDKNYSTRLGCIAETAQDAWNTITEQNPTFLIQNWGFEGQVD